MSERISKLATTAAIALFLAISPASASAPSEGFFDTDAVYQGAFAEDLWIEEWTRFGDESWYTQP
jgi:hypothetical protein